MPSGWTSNCLLTLPFVDERGKQVKLGDYFGKRPVILALVYYQVPDPVFGGAEGVGQRSRDGELQPGKDFDIVVVSFDPSEGPALARAKKAMYVERYGRPDTRRPDGIS